MDRREHELVKIRAAAELHESIALQAYRRHQYSRRFDGKQAIGLTDNVRRRGGDSFTSSAAKASLTVAEYSHCMSLHACRMRSRRAPHVGQA